MQQIGFALTKGEMMQQLALELESDNDVEPLHISYKIQIEDMFDCWWEIVGGSNPGGILSRGGRGRGEGCGGGRSNRELRGIGGKYCSIPPAESHLLKKSHLKMFTKGGGGRSRIRRNTAPF